MAAAASPGATDRPLSALRLAREVVGGNYGLGSKEFAPRHAKAVFDNLLEQVPKKHFTVGINDDVTKTNLPLGPVVDCVPDTTKQCVFWGLGSDGTVGANKARRLHAGKSATCRLRYGRLQI